ncbi:hypothetical protein GII30_22495 [Gordonia amarae]|uniref:Uncharacterized protein n=2 Tax=Gordonia amarae TaxID=36821 RepID=G7GLN9_9ACTN|nr:hypothetical protein [Gordonia amarae]MCS3876555.1 hypothetical protein [Gordonia amarae]QHN19452.1 hypothetical protein GII35_22960 [Gordonia amarae]QHN23928.1 hypothetical protein GII34_22460 [Gordonia amarae]QHN32838.1 hypothetical protein GII32_22790 [Gordonia amarae]QHN41557.1 hypothetical protein GII30_22495 [Gordonia amarae]
MSKRGPLFTIAAVALLGLILIAVNVFNGNDDNSTPTASTKSTSADRSGTAPSGDKTGAGATGNDDTRNDGGPAGDLFPSKGKYVGTLPPEPSGTMTLSVTVDGDKALAYACDGDTVESWLSGSAKDGKLDLTGKNNARMTGTLDGTDVVGVLNLGQKRWNYTVGQVRSPAGLYVEKSNGEVTAWIVDAAGSVTGVKLLADGSTTAAPDIPLRDGKLTDPSVIQVTSPDDVS